MTIPDVVGWIGLGLIWLWVGRALAVDIVKRDSPTYLGIWFAVAAIYTVVFAMMVM